MIYLAQIHRRMFLKSVLKMCKRSKTDLEPELWKNVFTNNVLSRKILEMKN